MVKYMGLTSLPPLEKKIVVGCLRGQYYLKLEKRPSKNRTQQQ